MGWNMMGFKVPTQTILGFCDIVFSLLHRVAQLERETKPGTDPGA